MKCEICGSDIKGKAYKVIIDRATLIACEKCAKRYKVSYEIPTKPIIKKRTSTFYKPRARFTEYEIVDDFAERIREAREAMGLTRELLAQMVGEKESTIRRIESGTLIPDINLARKLERVLKIVLVVESSLYYGEEGYSSKKYELTLGDIIRIKKKK